MTLGVNQQIEKKPTTERNQKKRETIWRTDRDNRNGAHLFPPGVVWKVLSSLIQIDEWEKGISSSSRGLMFDSNQ